MRTAVRISSMTQEKHAVEAAPHIALRAAKTADQEFLLQVYASTREQEMRSWGWPAAQQTQFLQMQFAARSRGYAATYPATRESIVLVNGEPAGYFLVFRGGLEFRLVDIALLPQFRSCGIGRSLISELISESNAANLPLRLSVQRSNSALRLYERLGFIARGGEELHCEMERTPEGNQQIR